MDDIVYRALILIVLMGGFIGICLWAWSSKRKGDFERASRLPLNDDETNSLPMSSQTHLHEE